MPISSLRRVLGAVATVAAMALPAVSQAGPYSGIYVFGDSLSDTGSLANVAGGGSLPPLPCDTGFCGPYSYNKKLSNGPIWVEHLTAFLGLPQIQSQSFTVGGNNFAFAGARTGVDLAPPGVLAQVAGIWGGGGGPTPGTADPNALYVVVGGGNDMRDARLDLPNLGASVGAALGNLANAVGYLAVSGARNILISNLPDLGLTPESILLNLQAQSSIASAAFNGAVGNLLALEGMFPGLDIDLLDMAGAVQAVLGNPLAYGITNTTLPCNGFAYAGGLVPGGEGNTVGANCSQSIFSDVLHPSAVMHSLIAARALEALGVPEPESLALVALGLVAIVATRRRQMAAAARRPELV